MVNLENVTDVFSSYAYSSFTYFLTADGELYFAGGESEIAMPQLEATGVTLLDPYGNYYPYALKDGKWYCLNRYGIGSTAEYTEK